MDVLTLARLQFGITTVYHFFFVPLTLGLVFIIALMESFYVRTNKDVYKRMTKFWGTLFLINFALGVATGIVQEFQFGMNWSDYSRFVGDIFGAPLAIEALLAFFLESTFLGIWLFGWDRLSKRLHLACIWLVVAGSYLSALWILIANSWMQEPVGYTLRNGRAELTDFFAVITNPHVFYQFPHVVFSGLATGSFFVLGISAFHLWRKRETEFYLASAKIAVTIALISSILVAATGHLQGQMVVKEQPMKMAAAEALWNTEQPAGFSLFSIINEKDKTDSFQIRIPYMLSILSDDNPTSEVMGLNQLQAQYVHEYGLGNYIPPVTVTFWSFRLMVGAGLLMILAALLGFLKLMVRKTRNLPNWLFHALTFCIALPFIANSTGWIMTEIGRQPWVVQGLLTTAKAVSPTVGVGSVLFSLIAFTLVYAALIVANVYLLAKYARQVDTGEQTGAKQQAQAESLIAY
jgi:Cytochrome bd-type quinol oxidase, subunit 1